MRKNRFRPLITIALLMLFTLVLSMGLSGFANDKATININEWSWSSGEVQARMAGIIIESVYGYPVKYKGGSSPMVVLGMREGDLDFGIGTWTENVGKPLNEAYIEGALLDLGQAYPNAPHGYYVPTYVIEGDEERGIEPMAPDLEYLSDLAKYWKVFKDPADPRKGRIYGVPSTWGLADEDPKLFKAVGIEDEYNKMDPGSQAGLVSAATGAYKKGNPVVFYYWEPTWLMGKYDFTKLKFDKVVKEKEVYPISNKVHIAANPSLAEKAPRVVNLLANYQVTLDQMNNTIAYMQETDANTREAAIWFLKNHRKTWHTWFPVVFEEEKRLINAVEEHLSEIEVPKG